MRILNRQGGIGDFTFFAAGLSLLKEKCEVNAMPRCNGLDWVFPANAKLRIGKRGEDWNALFEHNKWRLATDRCTLAEIGLAGYYREGPVPIITPPDEFCSYGAKTLKRLAGDMPVVAITDCAMSDGRVLDIGWANECARAAWEAGYYPLALGTETRLDYRFCDTSLVGQQTLNEALGTLLHCAALVSIDTGLACFAAAMNVPLVGVYTTQLPWLRLARLPGPSVGFACAKRSIPKSYGGDFEAGDMPPLEVATEALFGLLEGEPPGEYWHNGEWFDDPLDGYYKVSARIDGPDLWDAIAALEETQKTVVTTKHVTIYRKADEDRAKWIMQSEKEKFAGKKIAVLTGSWAGSDEVKARQCFASTVKYATDLSIECILFDNGVGDAKADLWEYAESVGWNVVHLNSTGTIAEWHNAAIEWLAHHASDYAVFIDDDSVFAGNAIKKAIDLLESNGAAGVAIAGEWRTGSDFQERTWYDNVKGKPVAANGVAFPFVVFRSKHIEGAQVPAMCAIWHCDSWLAYYIESRAKSNWLVANLPVQHIPAGSANANTRPGFDEAWAGVVARWSSIWDGEITK